MTDLYRLVYASKNLLQGTEHDIATEIHQILEVSQRNNMKIGVTGALMFNAGSFAQVLEGPRNGVEATFERIQRDLRHSDVTVLQCVPVESRGFANWSMAFVGHSSRGRTQFSSLAAESGFDPSRMSGDGVFAMLHGLVLEEEGLSPTMADTSSSLPVRESSQLKLDVEQVRAEVAQLRQMTTPVHTTATSHPQGSASDETAGVVPHRRSGGERSSDLEIDAVAAVLKASLASERQRTTELRDEIDELRIALALSHDQLAAMREERNLWASRANLLAKALAHEASDLSEADQRSSRLGAHPNEQGHDAKLKWSAA
ncbi:blue light sensor protein [Methylobacterium currus]|jgi:blue light- and temperature-responsive anti-repressor|uniref:Blue light sensor protein n=1 Tax=Methylobacterium currus TaxID=2051553 RepID=A0A2R4WWF9_9HYPH|nr:BLUF domain-containing protein [Methylobacterium currus]AWB25888.1 blue light sensor protein [Methylobacterium currus]